MNVPRITSRRAARRGGVTLTEVLVSLGIMSIGIVTLATLFPLSLLRTIQATQLTNATIHRYNVEGTIRAFPDLLASPGGESFYVVDPSGYYRAEADGLNKDVYGPVKRYRGYTSPLGTPDARSLDADEFVTSPDSWKEILTAIPTNVDRTATPNTATFDEDLSAITPQPAAGTPGPEGDRIVFFDDNARGSIVRTITKVDTGTRTVEFDPIPASYNIAEARIETQDFRYSWMLTVRDLGGGDVAKSVDVAIFFNRGFLPEDEQFYPGYEIPLPPPETGTRTTAFVQDSPTVTVRVPSGVEPAIKSGGFVLDSRNLLWYRIARIESQTTNGSNKDFVLTLTEPAKVNSNSAMFPPQLVDVYPIGKPLQR